MIYDEAVVQGRLRETLDKAFETVRAMMPVFTLTPAERGVEFMREFASRLSLEILLEALAAKHPTYRAEAEVRLTIASRRSVLALSIETRARGIRQFLLYVRSSTSGRTSPVRFLAPWLMVRLRERPESFWQPVILMRTG
ncbi:MAG: hypothetical protein ACXWLB_12385 [Reyranella sp.]